MANIQNNIEDDIQKNEKIIDIWGRRNPRFEKKYETSVLRILSDYGVGASAYTSAKGKVLGAGYEVYILAFFIGLYANKRLPLSRFSDDLKPFGQPLQFWGNLDSKKGRKAYSGLRPYIFCALVAKTDIDWIALDKGLIPVSSAVSKLIETMEEYANYGLAVMEDKLSKDKSYFFTNKAFLDIFLQLTTPKENEEPVTAAEDL